MPAAFDSPLEPHHKVIGRWVVARGDAGRRFSRTEAKHHIESEFDRAVLEILRPVAIANLRVVAFRGDDQQPPALAIICDDVGQIELGWIEKSNVLASTLFGPVAPAGWRAAAYQALAKTLPAALPIFGFEELMEELSSYWDGATDDEGARRAMIEWQGVDPEDVEEDTLPSAIRARRPDWMTVKPAPLKHMPAALADRLRALFAAHQALRDVNAGSNAWQLNASAFDYVPGLEDAHHMPPLTLVPFDHFARELDDICRHGMEYGFMDVAGITPLHDAAGIEAWFASFDLGAKLLAAAQAVIEFDPATSRAA